MSFLSKIFNTVPSGPAYQGLTSYNRILPNNAGSYAAPIVPQSFNPNLAGPTITPPPEVPIVTPPDKKITGGGSTIFSPQRVAQPAAATVDNSNVINPKTGLLYTPMEYRQMMANKARGGGVQSYASSHIASPNQTLDQMTEQGFILNNARNDIATGATDPYGVASKSGMQYTPAELSAIEKAYAGVYDPALTDVFGKIENKKKEAEDAKKLEMELKKMEKQFGYDMAIAQAKDNSTTGGLTANQLQSSLDKIHDDFRMDPATQQYTQAAAGWDTLSKISPEDSTSADDMAAIYAFAKIMDPNSVVREGEYATVQKYAQSWAESFGFNAKRIFTNTKFLSPQAIRNLQETSKLKTSALEAAYRSARTTYEQRQKAILEGNVASGLPEYGYSTSLPTGMNVPAPDGSGDTIILTD